MSKTFTNKRLHGVLILSCRALKLKPNFLGAWTLIGHEYLELRNFSQACNAYRMAISGNQNDYRAWYGLGQAYEHLKLYSFALTNYMKASNLIPYDDRVWISLGKKPDESSGEAPETPFLLTF